MISPFVYLSEYRVVACTECKYAMSAGGVRAHLAGKHAGILDAEKCSIADEISHIPGIIQDEQELDGFQFPSPATKAIPELAEPETDGLGCKVCWYVSRQRQRIQKHYRIAHPWSSKRKRGQHGRVPEEEVPWVSGVRCQRFFRTRVNSRWFEVDGREDRAGGWIDRVPASSEGSREDGSESSEEEVVWFETRPIVSGSGLGSSAAYSGFSSSMESDNGDMRFVSAMEARSQTVASSQTMGDSSQQPVIAQQTAPRPMPYQRDPARSDMRHKVTRLIEYLEHWSKVFPLCPLCHLMEDDSDPQHRIEDCPRTEPPVQEIARAIRAVERGLREGGTFERAGVCPKCGVPRELDNDLSGHRHGLAEGQCKYEGVLAGGFVAMYVAGFPEGIEVLGAWFDRDLVDRLDGHAAMRWFRGRVVWEGMEVMRALRVFYMLSNKNVGKRYMGQYNMGIRSIEGVEWIWKSYLE